MQKSAPAPLAKRLRCHSRLLAEKPGEVRWVRKGEVVGDLVDRLVREHELALGFSQDALTDQVPRRYAGCSFDMIVDPVRRHRQLAGVETDHAFLAEMFIDQSPQFVHARIGARQRY